MGNPDNGEVVSRTFAEELENVRGQVLKMGGLVEDQLSQAVRALIESDASLAHEVVHNDYRVNAMDVAIDEECMRIVAQHQPIASDLRMVMAVIKTTTDLERIGDEAKRVARMVVEEKNSVLNEAMRQELEHMGVLVRDMLSKVLDSFARLDVETAIAVVRQDNKVDAKYGAITRQLATYMAEDTHSIPLILNVLWAVRSLERMGDRCQNIAEYVFYLVYGRDIRHTSVDEALAEIAPESVKSPG